MEEAIAKSWPNG